MLNNTLQNQSRTKKILRKTLKICAVFLVILLLLILLGKGMWFFFPSFCLNLAARTYDYFDIWDFWEKWCPNVSASILFYYIMGAIYNHILFKKTGINWLGFKERVWLIIVDLLINILIGIWFVWSPETLMGALMLKCPIFFSPIFFLAELLSFQIYYASKTNPKFILFLTTNKTWLRFAAPFKRLALRIKIIKRKIIKFFNE